MRSTLLSGACAVSILLALTSSVQAADIDAAPEPAGWGWYLSVFGGWSLPDDVEGNGEFPTGTEFDLELELDDGFTAGLALGASINNWLRGEVEASGNWHDLSGDAVFSTVGFLGTSANATGDVDALFLLGNLWVDLPIGEMFRPYIGGGAGLGRLDVDFSTTTGAFTIDDSGWGFAYQVGAGVAFDLTPNMAIDIGYRYKAINNVEIELNVSGIGSDMKTDYSSHNILAGVRWGF